MRRWRAVRVSNPCHRRDKATASPDASQRVELVRLARLERALYGFSNRSLCHWGTDAHKRAFTPVLLMQHKWWTPPPMIRDLTGQEPAALRIKLDVREPRRG